MAEDRLESLIKQVKEERAKIKKAFSGPGTNPEVAKLVKFVTGSILYAIESLADETLKRDEDHEGRIQALEDDAPPPAKNYLELVALLITYTKTLVKDRKPDAELTAVLDELERQTADLLEGYESDTEEEDEEKPEEQGEGESQKPEEKVNETPESDTE